MEHSKNVNEFMGTSGQVRGLSRDLGRERLKDHSQVLGKRMWIAHRHVCWDSTLHVDAHRRASLWKWTGPANQHPLCPVTGCSNSGTSGHDRIAVEPGRGTDYISLQHGFLVSSTDTVSAVCDRDQAWALNTAILKRSVPLLVLRWLCIPNL